MPAHVGDSFLRNLWIWFALRCGETPSCTLQLIRPLLCKTKRPSTPATMTSLGANVTIPDQVVLVGGTGRHLSDRFGAYGGFTAPRDAGINAGVRDGPSQGLFGGMRSEMYSNGYGMSKNNTIQDRLGPRRFTGNDMNQLDLQEDLWDTLPTPAIGRPHVLKRLGQQTYSPWDYAQNGYTQHDDRSGYGQSRSGGYGQPSYNSGQVGRGAGRPRRARGYYNSYGGYRYNRYSYSPYNYYSSYSSPYSSYYNYSRPRFGNYTKYYGTSYTPFRNYSSSYSRGRYYGGSGSYNRARRGRYSHNSSRSHITQEELDRDLDNFRAGGETKKERKDGDARMS